MTAVLGRPSDTARHPLSDTLGAWFVGSVIVCGFGSLPTTGRMPVLLMIALGSSTVLLYDKYQLGRIRLSVPILLLTTWITASYAWSNAPWRTLFTLQYTLVPLILLLIVGSVLPLASIRSGLLYGAYTNMAINIAGLVLQPGTTLVDDNGYRAVHGYFVHKNGMAPFMAFVVGAALVLDRDPRRRRIAMVTGSLLVLLSLSATGMIALLGVLGFEWLVRNINRAERDRRAQLVLGSITGSVVFAYFWVTYLPQILSVYGKDTTFSGRTEIWSFATWAIRLRPWLGYGLEGAWQPPSIVVNAAYARLGHVPTHAHEGTLQLLLDIGFIGFGLWLLFFVSTWLMLWRAASQGSDLARLGWVLGVMILLVGISESVFLWPWLPIMMLMRIVALRWRDGEREALE